MAWHGLYARQGTEKSNIMVDVSAETHAHTIGVWEFFGNFFVTPAVRRLRQAVRMTTNLPCRSSTAVLTESVKRELTNRPIDGWMNRSIRFKI